MQVILDNTLPSSLELECNVLANIIFNQKELINIISILKPEVFYNQANNIICSTIIALNLEGKPIDLLTVSQALLKSGNYQKIGGASYLTAISNNIGQFPNTEYYYRLLLQYYYRREIINMGFTATNQGMDDTVDVFELYDKITSQLDEINIHIGHDSIKGSSDVVKRAFEIMLDTSVKNPLYEISDNAIDKTLMLSPENIILFAGKSGSGKTSYVCYLAFMLLHFHKDIAICWYSMEDPAYKILFNYVSPALKLTNSQLQQKGYTLSEQEIKKLKSRTKMFEAFDIEFREVPSYISHIKTHFEKFCHKRPNKFCILIIDNIMLLKDNMSLRFKSKSLDIDDHIANSIQSIFTNLKNKFKINVWFVHHLTKEQLSKNNITDGYRPKEDQIKGSTRYKDIITQGILVHRPGEFPDLVKVYKETPYHDPLNHLFISEIFKNRDGKTGLIRHFCNLDYKIFHAL